MRFTITIWLCAILFCLLISAIFGCYTYPKAKSQFSKAAVAYPEIPADYCARTYPPKDSLIKGDSVITFDTLYVGGETLFDTVKVNDTVRITKVIKQPAKIITKEIFRVDTLEKESTGLKAKYDLCEIEMHKAINLATTTKAELKKWEGLAKKRFWIIAGMGAAFALGIVALIRRKVVKKVV